MGSAKIQCLSRLAAPKASAPALWMPGFREWPPRSGRGLNQRRLVTSALTSRMLRPQLDTRSWARARLRAKVSEPARRFDELVSSMVVAFRSWCPGDCHQRLRLQLLHRPTTGPSHQ